MAGSWRHLRGENLKRMGCTLLQLTWIMSHILVACGWDMGPPLHRSICFQARYRPAMCFGGISLGKVEGNTLRFWFFLIWISVTSGQTCAISQSYKSIDWVHALSLSDNLTSLAKTSQSQFQWQETLCRPCSHPPNWLSAKDATASGSTTSNAVPQHVLARTPRQ